MNNYKSKDFKQMLFPVFDLEPEADLFKQFPALKSIKAFQNSAHGLDHMLVLRYVFFCYDLNSKLQEISDLRKRKLTATTFAGFYEKTEMVERMITNKLTAVNDMIVAFCRLQNNRLFQMKITALEAFHEYQRIIIEPIDQSLDDDKMMRAANLKTKLIEDCDLIHNKINKYNEELYGSKEDADELEEAFVRISPETISKMEV